MAHEREDIIPATTREEPEPMTETAESGDKQFIDPRTKSNIARATVEAEGAQLDFAIFSADPQVERLERQIAEIKDQKKDNEKRLGEIQTKLKSMSPVETDAPPLPASIQRMLEEAGLTQGDPGARPGRAPR